MYARRILLFAGLLLVVGLLAACGGGAPAPAAPPTEAPVEPTQPPAPEIQPAKIGVMVPLTGPLSEFGGNFQKATELAQKHLAAAGYEIELKVGDTETSAIPAVETARQLVEVEGVHALIGAAASGVTIPIAESVTIPNQVPQISNASTSPLITNLPADEGQDFLFRTAPSDALQGVVLAALARAIGYDTISVLYVNNPYGQGLNDVFKENFEAAGGKLLASVPHDETAAPTYVAELRQATEGNPDALIALSYPGHATVYLREALEGDFIDTFLFVDGTKSQELPQAVGAGALDGMCGTAPGSAETPSLDLFNQAYEAEYGEVPPLPFMTNIYDGVVVAALAAYEAQVQGQELTPVNLRDHLRSVANPPGETVAAGAAGIKKAIQLLSEGKEINFEGAAGAIDFDENGDVVTPVEIWCYEGGEIVSKQLAAPGEEVAPPVAAAPVPAPAVKSVCLVTDVGRVNDGTFNQFAYEGMVRAAEEFGLESTFIETQAQTDYDTNINTCVSEGFDVIVTVGFLIADATLNAATANPDVFFIGVDQFFVDHPDNLVGIQYREDQGGFLAGALAAMMTESGTVAGVYGIDIPPVVKFRNGFEQGAKYINPDINLLGVYIDDFVAPDRGASAAEQFMGEGADVIFGAGGPTGSGGIKRAAEEGVWVIGVDQDEYFTTFGSGTTPGADRLISSAVKRVDLGVYDMIAALVKNMDAWRGGGLYILEAANGGISYAPPHDAPVPQDVLDKLEAIRQGLADGSIDTGVDPVTGELK